MKVDRIRQAYLVVGALTLFSVAFYAFTGMGFWAPVPDGPDGVGRGFALGFLHVVGFVLGICGIVWTTEKDRGVR